MISGKQRKSNNGLMTYCTTHMKLGTFKYVLSLVLWFSEDLNLHVMSIYICRKSSIAYNFLNMLIENCSRASWFQPWTWTYWKMYACNFNYFCSTMCKVLFGSSKWCLACRSDIVVNAWKITRMFSTVFADVENRPAPLFFLTVHITIYINIL